MNDASLDHGIGIYMIEIVIMIVLRKVWGFRGSSEFVT